jgi:hypothetical protein
MFRIKSSLSGRRFRRLSRYSTKSVGRSILSVDSARETKVFSSEIHDDIAQLVEVREIQFMSATFPNTNIH